ncbi:MAG TPA: extracellular solute-binding protein [Gaiellaceae bacterium]|nr:extracellular solute-binding protein [Gaiellaceae bacterium]
MKTRIIAAVALAAALAIPASTASGGTTKASATKIVVWLQTDAQNGWPTAVAAANSAFKAQHPGADVDVQYQQWTTHLPKFDAAIAAGDVPDVIEMGNTETTGYMAAGAFASLKAKNYPNSRTWLTALKQSCSFGGKLYCIPYYAGARAVIYRKDLYRSVGQRSAPKTYKQFLSVGKKLMKKYGKNPNFSAFYEPGQNWYVAMSFVADYGGQIAVNKGGKWKGTLDSPQAIKALTVFKSMVRSLSRASKTNDESHPFPSIPFAKGRAAAFIGNGWEWPYVFDPKGGAAPKSFAAKMGAYPMPSHIAGRYTPTFLGGSDLAIPGQSKNKSLAADWIKAFTNSSNERVFAKAGNIANTTTLLDVNKTNPQLAPFAKAAKYSWFVPTAPNWVKVEKANILKNMLTAILTNRTTVAKGAAKASSQITKILNTKS